MSYVEFDGELDSKEARGFAPFDGQLDRDARRPLPAGVAESDAGAGRGRVAPSLGGLAAPTARRGTPAVRPYVAPGGEDELRKGLTLDDPNPGHQYDADPLLNPQYVERVRASFADMPEDRRLPYLRNLARGGDVQARAARVLLPVVEQENERARQAANANPELASAYRPASGGSKAGGPVSMPDLAPSLAELANSPALATDDRTPERLAAASRRAAGGRAIEAAQRGVRALQQRATLRDRVRAQQVEAAPEGLFEGTALDNAAGMVSIAGAKGLYQAADLGLSALRMVPLGDAWDEALGSAQDLARHAAELADRAQGAEDRKQWAEMSHVLSDKEAGPLTIAGFLMAHPRLLARLGVESGGTMVPMVAAGRFAGALTTRLAERAIGGAAKSPAVAAELQRMAQAAAGAGAVGTNVAMGAGGAYDQALRNGSSRVDAANAALATGVGYALMARLTGGGAEAALAQGKKTSLLKAGLKEGGQESGESYSESLGAAITPEAGLDVDQANKQALLEGMVGTVVGGAAEALTQGEAQQERARRENAALFDRYFGATINPDGTAKTPTQARAESASRFDELAAAHGLEPRAAARVKAEIDGLPSGDVPTFLTRATEALNKRGLFKRPVDAQSAQALLEAITGTPSALAQAEGANKVAPNASFDGVTDPSLTAPIDEAAHGAATSPLNDLPEPTEGQKKAGNYAKGHSRIAGLPLTIKNPQGSTRRGVDADGTPWERTMTAHYGYVNGTRAGVFVAPGTPDDYDGPVFVIDQVDPKTGSFDEHKAVIGVATEDEARALYESNYAAGWQGLGAITRLPMQAYKAWVNDGVKRKPLGQLIPAGEAAELIPSGDATEVPQDDAVSAWLGAKDGRTDSVRGEPSLPVGEATELEPELIEPQTQQAAEMAQQSGAQRPTELAIGQRLTLDGKAYTVAKLGKASVTLSDESGSRRVVSRSGATWPRVVQAASMSNGEQRGGAPVAESQAPGRSAEGEGAVTRAPDAAAPQPSAGAAPKPRVFKTRKGAEQERDRLGNEHKLRKVKGGFILRKKTDAESAAEARNARRMAAGAMAGTRRSLLSTIAAGGGLAMSARADTIGEGNRNIGGRMLFTRAGKTIHQWAETLGESGFIPPNELANDDGVRWLQDAIQEEYAGRREFFAMSDEERMAEMAAAAQGEAPVEDPDPLSDFDLEALTDDGYAQASPQVQALTEQLLAEAEALGIDTETIREDAARATEGASEDEYHSQVQAAIKRGIAQAQADAARRDAQAARGSGEDRGEAAGTQGKDEGRQALELQAQTPEDLRQKTEREAAALEAERTKKAAEQERLRKEALDKEAKARADRTVDDFELGKSAEQQMSGMGDLFAAPSAQPAPETGAAQTETAKIAQERHDDARRIGLEAGRRGDPREPPQAFTSVEKQLWRAGWDEAHKTRETPQVAAPAEREIVELRKRVSVLRALRACLDG